MAWNIVNAAYPQVLRGILQQTDAGLPYIAPERLVSAGGLSPAERMREVGLRLRRFELHNRSGGAANVGIGFRWANRYWAAGQWVDATPLFTDDTTDAQDGPVATADFPLMTTTASDGFIIHSDRQFSWVSVRIETASVGASVDVTGAYTNFAGDDWTAFTTAASYEAAGSTLLITAGTNYGDAEERILVFAPPNDWGKTQAAGLSGIPGGRYAFRFRTDVATTAGSASVIEVGSMIAVEALADNGIWEQEQSTFFDPYAEALVAFFSVANAGNRVVAEVTTG